jgi:hypothetical protein
MTDRKIQLGIVSIVLFGPILSLLSNFWTADQILFGFFPITADSLAPLLDPKQYMTFNFLGMIFSLFFIKVLVIGVVCWIRLSKKRAGGSLLTRFYLLVLIICLFKIAGATMVLADSFNWQIIFLGLFPMLTWVTILVWVIRRPGAT